jgi:hypothetical protein
MSGFGLDFYCSLGRRRARLNYGSKLLFLSKNHHFYNVFENHFFALLSPSGPKVIQNPSKTPPKMESNGLQNQPFQQPAQKVILWILLKE